METVKTIATKQGKTLDPKERIPTIIFNHLLSNLDFEGSDVDWIVGLSEHEDWSLELESDQDGTFNVCVVFCPLLGTDRQTYKCALSSEQLAKLKEAANAEYQTQLEEYQPECRSCDNPVESEGDFCSSRCKDEFAFDYL